MFKDILKNKKLFGAVVPPPEGVAAKQLIIFLHGVGADGEDLISLSAPFRQYFPDAYFASPNAPFPFDMAPMGYQWFSLRDLQEEELIKGIRQAEPILQEYIDRKLEMLGLDESKLAVLGFSQGAMMALHHMPRRAKPAAAVVAMSGALLAPQFLGQEIRSKPNICLIHGDSDMVVPFNAMPAADYALRQNGINVISHKIYGLGHGIDDRVVDIAINFLRRNLATASNS